ncbi:MAG: HNH endonuclease [Anaerolineaceae bacterium]|nr:HNH endonuclease [Anaerolineaceae bacterium]MCB9101556.1 HNH endonuclease [Anaerolineales bacterium]
MSKTHISTSLRQQVYDRAKGCCEYCLIPEIAVLVPHQIDHVIAEKHGGTTDLENLALSCTLCNKYKGSDIASLDPKTRNITPLYNPRQDRWRDHFQLNNAEFMPLTSIGRVTVRLLQMNRPDRVKERQLLILAKLINIPD